MARAKTPDISLPPLAEQFCIDTIDQAMREISRSTSVDMHTYSVATQALLRAKEAIQKDAALWKPVP